MEINTKQVNMSASRSVSGSSYSYSSSSEKETIKKKNHQMLPEFYEVIIPKTDIPFDSIKLDGDAERTARLYCGYANRQRVRIYRNDHPKQAKLVKKNTTIEVLKHDKLKNAKIMTICTVVLGGIGSIGWVAGPVGGAPGTTLGVLGGMALGGVLLKNRINKKIRVQISISDHFAQWRADAIINKVYPIFNNFINGREEFQDFICPILQDICSIPVLAPDGQTYDKDSIEAYITSLGADDDDPIQSPYRNGTFCKNDLVINTQYCKDIIEKAKEVYQEVIIAGDDSVKAHGLDAVKKNTKEIMHSLMTQVEYQVWAELKPDVESGKINTAQRDAIVARTVAQWDWKVK